MIVAAAGHDLNLMRNAEVFLHDALRWTRQRP
jgi:hypothetical protein